MSNRKKKKARARKKGQSQAAGPKKPPQQDHADAGPHRPPSNKPQKQAKQASRDGERRMSASERRAEARRVARRKRQITSVVIPLVVIVLALVVLFLVNGGVEGGGEVSASGDVTAGEPRTEELKVGDPIPPFSAPELTEGRVDWADYQGKPAALAVWAAWCPNCQKELPVLEKLSKEFPEVPVVSIVTSQGQEPGPTPEQYVESPDKYSGDPDVTSITYPVAVDDPGTKMLQSMGVTGFPTLFFVNADGTVNEVYVGLQDEGTLRSKFQELTALASGAPGGGGGGDKNKEDG